MVRPCDCLYPERWVLSAVLYKKRTELPKVIILMKFKTNVSEKLIEFAVAKKLFLLVWYSLQ